MANCVYHTGYGITIHLTHADLGHPDRPYLLDEITQPIDKRPRELLECMEHHGTGTCRAEDEERSPWMAIRRRTISGHTYLVAAHLPVRHHATVPESEKHKAMKERIAKAAERHGLHAELEARTADGKVRNDVLVTGPAARIGWEAQYAPITSPTVRRRSRAAADHHITPLWVTDNEFAPLIDCAPWVRLDDVHWKALLTKPNLLVRAGVRYLQRWKCSKFSERSCPSGESGCGRLHVQWDLPALCLPRKDDVHADAMVGASAYGDFVPMRIPSQAQPHQYARMWTTAEDRDEWRSIVGPEEEEEHDQQPSGEGITFTEEEIDSRCRYGEQTSVFNDARPRRSTADAAGLHTFDRIPQRLFRIPKETVHIAITAHERQVAATLYGCPPWEIGPCAGCGTAIPRYSRDPWHACARCRARYGRSA